MFSENVECTSRGSFIFSQITKIGDVQRGKISRPWVTNSRGQHPGWHMILDIIYALHMIVFGYFHCLPYGEYIKARDFRELRGVLATALTLGFCVCETAGTGQLWENVKS